MAIKNDFVYSDPSTGLVRWMFDYDRKTGKFEYTKEGRPAQARHYSQLGCVTQSGRVLLSIKGKQYQANRLAWIWMHGDIPHGMEIGYREVMDHHKPETVGHYANRESNLKLMTRTEFNTATAYRQRVNERMEKRKPAKQPSFAKQFDKGVIPTAGDFTRLLMAARKGTGAVTE